MNAGPGRPRDPNLASRVRAATLDLLLERGVEGTTVDAVAERAVAGKASVYRRWRTKDDLMLDALNEAVSSEVPMPDTGSLRGDMTRVLTDLVTFWQDDRGGGLLRLMIGAASRDHTLHQVHLRVWERQQRLAKEPISAARARGELSTDIDDGTVLDMVLGPISARIVTGRALPEVTDVPRLVDLILGGLAAR